MKKNYYSRVMVLIISSCCLCALMAYMAIGVFAKNDGNNIIQNLDAFVAAQKRCIELNEKVGGNSMYAQLVTKTECHKLAGESEKEAFKSSKEEIIEDSALQKFAKEQGVSVTEEETGKYIESLINDASQDELHSAIVNSCTKKGIHFEDTFYKNKEHYQIDLLKRKLYDRNVKKLVGARTKLDENRMKRIKEEWNDIKTKAVLSYKATSDYKTVAMFIDKINKYSKTMDVNERGNRRITDIEYIRY